MQENLIIDVGMHNGDDTAYYLHRGYKVVAIEANPNLVAQTEARFKEEIRSGQLQILNVGIAEAEGLLDFWICESKSALSSFDKEKASPFGTPSHSIEVPCQTFDWVLETYGIPYYLKVDIEGKDDLCLEALPKADLPKYVSIEASGDLDKLKKLNELGYTHFKCISQFYFLPVQLPPIKETKQLKYFSLLNFPGRAVDQVLGRKLFSNRVMSSCWQDGWFFSFVSSGPFGEDTLGDWLTFEEIMSTYSHFTQLFDEGEDSPYWRQDKYRDFWADFHARRDDSSLD